MRDLQKDVEWIEFSDEGHSLWQVEPTSAIYYDAVFKLLERTIGKGEPPFPPLARARRPRRSR
jgi:hypothetical protein